MPTNAEGALREPDPDAAYRMDPILRGKVLRMRVPARPEEAAPETEGVAWRGIGVILAVVGGLAVGFAVVGSRVQSPPPQPAGAPADATREVATPLPPLPPPPESESGPAPAPPPAPSFEEAQAPPSPPVATARRPEPRAAPVATALRTVRSPPLLVPLRPSPPPQSPKLLANSPAPPAKVVAPAIEAAIATAVAPAPAATPCGIAASFAQQMVCDDPALAAADRRMSQVYAAALAAGVSPEELRLDQEDWLSIRELAARRSRRSVATVYQQRIYELETMIRERRPARPAGE